MFLLQSERMDQLMLSDVNVAEGKQTAGKRAYGGATAEARRLERRDRLLDAAKEVFGVSGYHNATVRMICEKAGLTERYFYESFSNSEALFIAMHKRTSERIITRLRGASKEGLQSETDRVWTMLAAYYGDIRRDPVSARLFAVDAGSISPMANEVCAVWRASFGQLLCDARGGGSQARDIIVRAGVVRGLLGIGVDWMEGGFAVPEAEVIAAGVQLATAISQAA